MRKVALALMLLALPIFAQSYDVSAKPLIHNEGDGVQSAKAKIEADAKPLIEQLSKLKASVYDYKKALEETEKQIDKINLQLADLQTKYNAILEEEKKAQPKK